jgi:hypothetical protein
VNKIAKNPADSHDGERDPQEEQHDVVRNRQQPLDQPQPAAQRLVQASSHLHRVTLAHGSSLPVPADAASPIIVCTYPPENGWFLHTITRRAHGRGEDFLHGEADARCPFLVPAACVKTG